MLTPEQLSNYERDGFLVLEDFVAPVGGELFGREHRLNQHRGR